MNARIAQFETLWNARLPIPGPLVRLTNEHELLPEDLRLRWWDATQPEEFAEIERETLLREMPRPVLIRQTNLHHLFSPELKEHWTASTEEERRMIEENYMDLRGF